MFTIFEVPQQQAVLPVVPVDDGVNLGGVTDAKPPPPQK